MPNLVEIAVALYKSGATMREISSKIGWTQPEIRKQLQLEGIYVGKRTPRSGRTATDKVGCISYAEASKLRNEGKTYKEIAVIAGVSCTRVSMALNFDILAQSP